MRLLTGYVVGNLKAVVYRLPLGIDIRLPAEEKELLHGESGDDSIDG